MINIELFKRTMAGLQKTLGEEKTILLNSNLSLDLGTENSDGIGREDLDNIITKANDTSFRLLVMGQFSSGKSAFINVLLGEKLLFEGALPATALITEIYYGENRRIVMYPREGKWKGGNEPFEIEPTLSEIKKYSTLNNTAGLNVKEANRIDSCFEKMVVYWPLDMLKDGVSIIDSPGTNDPYANDHIVEEYVPKADAILYCIGATAAYTMKDKETLEKINSIGFSNPIVVTTYFDFIKQNYAGDTESIEEFVEATTNQYIQHTTKECCHYVNSRQGMDAKRSGSNIDYVESGYSELEDFLSKYLTENRGKEKIATVTKSTEIYNANQIKRINGIVNNLDTPLEKFEERMKEAGIRLNQAKQAGELIKREFKLEMKNAKDEINEIIPSLYDSLYNEINLDDFTPNESFKLIHPRESAKKIAEECAEELKNRNEMIVARWNKEVLSPKLTESFERIAKKMDSQFRTFSNDIDKANLSISIDTGVAKTGNSAATNVALFAYFLFTGDWMNALLGGMFGGAALGRTLLCQFTAGLVLGIAALFTPIGLPALVIAALASTIVGVGWTASKAADTIKSKSIKETKKHLTKQREEIIANVSAKCSEIFDTAERNLHNAIVQDIDTVNANIEIIKKERKDSSEKIEQRRKELGEVITFLEDVNSNMAKVKDEFRII